MLLDGLFTWTERKGFQAVDELPGILAVLTDTDERHTSAPAASARAANASDYGRSCASVFAGALTRCDKRRLRRAPRRADATFTSDGD